MIYLGKKNWQLILSREAQILVTEPNKQAWFFLENLMRSHKKHLWLF